MDSITKKAYAKINLGLDVLGRLPNGYHEVKMIMQMIDLYDELTAERNTSGQIEIFADSKELPVNEDNLIYKAAILLLKEAKLSCGVTIRLTKNIPIAAGMAGGSSDAATTLKLVNELFEINYSIEKLMELGVKIGADVPYCLLGRTALSEGIGEKLTVIKDMPDCHILIAKPDIAVSTALVYKELDSISDYTHPDIDGMIDAINSGDLNGVIARLENVLENVTVSKYPMIAEIKKEMLALGASGSLMSGSGPTVFGIFTEKDVAQTAYSLLKTNPLVKDIALTAPMSLC